MYKKLKVILLTILILLSKTTFASAFDENDDPEVIDVNSIIETSTDSSDVPNINSVSAVVIERNTNTILYSKDANSKRKMASTTKIMTATLVLENCNLDEKFNISSKAASVGGSRLGLTANIEMSVRDLLYGLLLCSGNDAAYALAEHVSGSVENFAILMNEKAKSLGLSNTSFVTPHGLDSDNHYTTAYELALLTNYALKNDTFKAIVSTKSYNVKLGNNIKSIRNTNELLGNLNGVYGVKTGFTNGANRCLVSATKRGNLDIICVVLGADTKKIRTTDSINLINYCFKNFEMIDLREKLDNYFLKYISNKSYKINKAVSSNIDLSYSPLSYEYYPLKRSKENSIDFSYIIDEPFTAPLRTNTSIGKINILVDSDKIIELDIISNKDILKKSIKYYLSDFILNYFHYLIKN